MANPEWRSIKKTSWMDKSPFTVGKVDESLILRKTEVKKDAEPYTGITESKAPRNIDEAIKPRMKKDDGWSSDAIHRRSLIEKAKKAS
jgi:hypothetical protein